MTDGVKDACCSSSVTHSQRVSDSAADITTNHLLTPRTEELKESLTNRNKLLNVASTDVAADAEMIQQFAHERQRHTPASHHSRSTTMLSHCRPPHFTAAVGAYIQLQTLAAIMRTSLPCDSSARQMMTAECLAVTHQRRSHMYNMLQTMKLAEPAAHVVQFRRQQHNNHQYHHQHHQHQHQSRADMTSTTQSLPDDRRYSDELTSHDVMPGQTARNKHQH